MPRDYRHIQEYEKEIIELYNQGKTLREIGKQLGFTYEQMQNFKKRYNKKQRIIEAGKSIHKKGSSSHWLSVSLCRWKLLHLRS